MIASYLLDKPITSFDSLDDELPEQELLLRRGKMVPLHGSGHRIVATHFLPGVEIMRRYRESTGKVVYIALDPRSVILNSVQDLRVPEAKRTEFVKDFVAHRGSRILVENGIGTWQQSLRQWTYPAMVRQHFPHAEVLTVRYEDMRDDSLAALRRIVEFLGIDSADEGRAERAVENGSKEKLEAVQQLQRTQGIRGLRNSPRPPANGQADGGLAWPELGAEADAAYQQWLREDEEFLLCVQRLGYQAWPVG